MRASHESIRAQVLFLSAKARTTLGCNLLGCGIEVNRLKRGGCLFEGIARREMEEYIIRTRCARSGLPSSEWIPNVWGLQSTTKSSIQDPQEWQNT